MKGWYDWSIQWKLTVVFSLVFIVSVIMIGTVFYVHSAKQIKNRTVSHASDTIAQVNGGIDLYFQDIDRLSLAIFADPIVQQVLKKQSYGSDLERIRDMNQMSLRLFNLASPWRFVQGVYVYSLDGRLYHSGRGVDSDHSITDEPWYSVVKKNPSPATPILWPTRPETTISEGREKVISLIRPIREIPSGTLMGYLKIDINVKVMEKMLVPSPNQENQSRLFLLSDQGNVIYENSNRLTGDSINDLHIPGLFQTKDLSMGETTWRGESYLYLFQKSDYTHWTTLVLIPSHEIVKESEKARDLVLLFSLLAIILITCISFVLAKRITWPLRLLMQNMERVKRGDLKTRIHRIPYEDEVGQLSRMFNTMLHSLERLISQVYEVKIREKDARLLALQAQINPHFLFNTLNMMKAMSRSHGAHQVAEMVETLAELIRYSIKGWGTPVLLKDELNHVQNYMDIQRMRFRNRFKFRLDIPPSLLNARVVKLSIQPLVENAITHGLGERKEGGEVTVYARQRDRHLEIGIKDNGKGFAPQTLASINKALAEGNEIFYELPSSGEGIGILNIDRRIKLVFGETYGIHIESKENMGAIVKLLLPCEKGEDKEGGNGEHFLSGR